MPEQEKTPLSTADVKRRYSWGMAPHKSIPGGMYTVAAAAADFDRWLTAHDAEVAGRALYEAEIQEQAKADFYGYNEHLSDPEFGARRAEAREEPTLCECGDHHCDGSDPEAREETVRVARVVHALASLAEEVIHSGDVAEVVAMPPGTTGLAAAVDARDSLYEEPAAWIRDQVENLHQILPAPEAREVTDKEVEAAAKAIVLELLRTIGTASTFEELAAAQMPMARREARAALEAAREARNG